MRTYRKMTGILLLVALVAALLMACGATPSAGESFSSDGADAEADGLVAAEVEEIPAEVEAIEPEETATPSPTPDLPDQQDEAGDFKGKAITFNFYDVESDEMKDVTVDMPADATLSFPLEVVAEQMFGLPLDKSILKANSVAQQDDSVYIDFTSDIVDANAGSSSETAVLDAVAAIYLDNIDGVKKVYISVDGNDYSSGHIEFSRNAPYK